MKYFAKLEPARRLLKRYWFFAALIAVIVLLCIGMAREAINRRQINDQLAQLGKQADQLNRENQQLQQLINSWDSGDSLEQKARQELNLKKPGEQVVIISRASDSPASMSDQYLKPNQEIVGKVILSEQLQEDNTPNPMKWWHYFFK